MGSASLPAPRGSCCVRSTLRGAQLAAPRSAQCTTRGTGDANWAGWTRRGQTVLMTPTLRLHWVDLVTETRSLSASTAGWCARTATVAARLPNVRRRTVAAFCARNRSSPSLSVSTSRSRSTRGTHQSDTSHCSGNPGVRHRWDSGPRESGPTPERAAVADLPRGPHAGGPAHARGPRDTRTPTPRPPSQPSHGGRPTPSRTPVSTAGGRWPTRLASVGGVGLFAGSRDVVSLSRAGPAQRRILCFRPRATARVVKETPVEQRAMQPEPQTLSAVHTAVYVVWAQVTHRWRLLVRTPHENH